MISQPASNGRTNHTCTRIMKKVKTSIHSRVFFESTFAHHKHYHAIYLKKRMFGVAAIGLFLLSSVPKARGQEVTLGVFLNLGDNEQCPIYDCCEQVCQSFINFQHKFDFIDTDLSTFYSIQDCCGKGTSGDETTQYCLDDPDSRGFDGSYSSSWESDCALRVCCERNCCSEGLEYDETQALCIPATCKDKKFQLIKPFNGEYTIDKAQLKDMYFCSSRLISRAKARGHACTSL